MRGAQIPGNLSPWRLNYCKKRLTSLGKGHEIASCHILAPEILKVFLEFLILLTLYGNNDVKNLSGETLTAFVAES
jgi:hypothetical protein